MTEREGKGTPTFVHNIIDSWRQPLHWYAPWRRTSWSAIEKSMVLACSRWLVMHVTHTGQEGGQGSLKSTVS